ncbi:LamB/YcsF family protein [Lysobacter yangpyeongensis]|uniref:LamB/YcsF family protein n=1 Tax=Lysobacter yangpyeongensis TaxID=346182 RepID=A0ABW0SJU1_9GAMM
MRIDFNCDLGEGCGDDAAIIPLVTSASIACGAHAGDEATMRTTLRLCREHGVAAGAHPGYPDRATFGRVDMPLPVAEIERLVAAQLTLLADIAASEGVRLAHVKPHGALYNRAARDRSVADAIAGAVFRIDPQLILVGLSGSQLTAAGEAAGLRIAHEVFAERRYEADGTLTPRSHPDAVIHDLDAAIAQVRGFVRDGGVIARTGEPIALRADTLCLHGDRADAAPFARAIREALQADGVRIAAVGAPA